MNKEFCKNCLYFSSNLPDTWCNYHDIATDQNKYCSAFSENVDLQFCNNCYFYNFGKCSDNKKPKVNKGIISCIFKVEREEMKSEMETQNQIEIITSAICDLLKYKNAKYGDSALKPKKVFSKLDSVNSILVRLDDKLSRMEANRGNPRINDVCDIIGYLVLLLISMGVSPEEIAKLKD